ncbi:MAG: CBS domain-containing protein [Candidatus Aenigmarchaeota archaeon]|nr:CBS domain-containing protein [Candidatus Aenigmarchaeota archaeon]
MLKHTAGWHIGRVGHIATKKVAVCREPETLDTVLERMGRTGYRRLPVIDNDGRLKGIITSVDVLRHVARNGPVLTSAGKVMNQQVHAFGANFTIEQAAHLFHAIGKGAYPVIEEGRLSGMLSEADFTRHFDRKVDIAVNRLMTHKPLVVGQHTDIMDAAHRLAFGYRRLPVVENGILLGILTPTDVLSHLAQNGWKAAGSKVKDAMRAPVITIESEADLRHAASKMVEKHLGGLPVTEDGELLGMVTERDLADLLFSTLKKGKA